MQTCSPCSGYLNVLKDSSRHRWSHLLPKAAQCRRQQESHEYSVLSACASSPTWQACYYSCYQTERQKCFFGGKKNPKTYIYIYVFPLLSHLHLDGRFTSKEKVERQNMCYSQLNIQKLTNYQIQFQISKIELLSALIS